MYGEENARFAKVIGVPAAVFSGASVALELPPNAVTKAGVEVGFMFAANLLSRIFTNLILIAPDLSLGPNAWGLQRISDLVPVLAEISEGRVAWQTRDKPDIVVGVGAPPTIAGRFSTYFSFSGCDAAIELELPENVPGPIGALFAACYGTAQAFVYAAQMVGAKFQPMRPFRLSLLNYAETGPAQRCPAQLDLGRVHLVGVGAIGSAAVYSLCHFPSVEGDLSAIDNDCVDVTNLHRYVLMQKSDASAGRAKVEVATRALGGQGITVRPYPMSFADFYNKHSDPIDLLLTPVDSEIGRRSLAAYLPRAILNASTGHTKVTISRHGFADGKACLACLYPIPNNEMTTEKRLAIELGLSVEEVTAHLADNRPVQADLLDRVEAHRRLPVGHLTAWVGQQIQSLYQRAVCGEAAISTATGTVISPLAFISAAAG